MIRATKHTIKFANKHKKSKYLEFLKEYRRVAQLYLNFLWNFIYVWEVDDAIYILDIKNNYLDVPKYLDKEINDLIQLNTSLSARALKCCITQVLGCLKSSLEERRKKLNLLKYLKKQNKSTTWLEKKIAKPLTKPNLSNINPELNSICCDLKFINSNEFNAFLQLKSLGKSFGRIRIPIKFYDRANQWKEKSKMKNSFLLSKKNINIRWEFKIEEKKIGVTVGADQGYKTTVTFSNKMITEQTDLHGHSLESITKKLSRQKKDSKAFERTQKHRQNFINWQINSLNFSNIKIVKLEKVVNVRFKKSSSRLMSHWCNPLIRDKILRICEESGTQVVLQDSTYRSQRCHQCGLVRKANRKGKEFKCSNCGMVCDADLNAAMNHEQELPNVPYNLRKLRKNRGSGFLWKPDGFFEITGEAITVPLSK